MSIVSEGDHICAERRHWLCLKRVNRKFELELECYVGLHTTESLTIVPFVLT